MYLPREERFNVDAMQQVQTNSEEYIRLELQTAAVFQRAVLAEPVVVPYLKSSVSYYPYGEVSGDVYHFLLNRERELAVFVGDATGHGVAAALMTMMVIIGLDGIRRDLSTDESIRRLNRLLVGRKTGMSVTGVFFRITPKGKLFVTHAGHPPLLVLPADGTALVQFEQGGCPLGIFDDEPVPYLEEHYQLQPGDKLIAYTDAVLEWENDSGEPFGTDRMAQMLVEHRQYDVDELKQRCLGKLLEYSQGVSCEDDLTLLVFEYTGQ